MYLENYVEKLRIEDSIKRTSRPLNKEFYEQKLKEALESGYSEHIEKNFLPSFQKLEPFAKRPLSVFYQIIKEMLFFHDRFPNIDLKKKIEKEYLDMLEKDLYELSDILNKNLSVALKNVLDKKFVSEENLAKVKELEIRTELKKVNREIVDWFNFTFEEYKICFNSQTCKYRAVRVRRDVEKKYSLELKAMQRERDLLRR